MKLSNHRQFGRLAYGGGRKFHCLRARGLDLHGCLGFTLALGRLEYGQSVNLEIVMRGADIPEISGNRGDPCRTVYAEILEILVARSSSRLRSQNYQENPNFPPEATVDRDR